MTPKVALIMGSDSDFEKLKGCVSKLKEFNIEVDVNVISAHRTPDKAAEFAKNAEENGIEVIICAAGMAAHLGGVIAAHTTVPVIGIPIKSTLDGMDALLATVQMPPGIPVATVGIDNGTNAAILAAQMLAIKYDYLKVALKDAKVKMVEGVEAKNKKIKELVDAAATEQIKKDIAINKAAKLVAAGASYEDVYLTFQESFEKPGRDGKRWGKPF